MEAAAKDTLELQGNKESEVNKISNGYATYTLSLASTVLDVVALHMNHPSAENAPRERVRTSPEEMMRNPICIPLRWTMNAMTIA